MRINARGLSRDTTWIFRGSKFCAAPPLSRRLISPLTFAEDAAKPFSASWKIDCHLKRWICLKIFVTRIPYREVRVGISLFRGITLFRGSVFKRNSYEFWVHAYNIFAVILILQACMTFRCELVRFLESCCVLSSVTGSPGGNRT